jgi:para-aminobenzoate synthetase component I
MSDLAEAGTPFGCVINFAGTRATLFELDAVPEGIYFDTPLASHLPAAEPGTTPAELTPHPRSMDEYRAGFDAALAELRYGNSYLLNLTYPTAIDCTLSLRDIFLRSHARYRLVVEGEWVCFSPEIFVEIDPGGTIRSHPMKGTIDATTPNAAAVILADDKERHEHNTIVDLIRNDLSTVATNVHVERFRYLQSVHTLRGELLQVSSEITGDLGGDWRGRLGEILFGLLPAGSVSGAPKEKTVEAILDIEDDDRGFYTGVFGLFDGERFDAGVLIRFIEQRAGGDLYYRSGGGITHASDCEKEYRELLEKIYLPME